MREKSLSPISSREQLVATIFHELRTPISSINGYALLLLTGEMGPLNTQQKETVGRIQELCQHTTTLTGNLLSLVKSESAPVRAGRELVDVRKVAETTLRSLDGTVNRKGIRMVSRLPEEEVRFWGEPGDLSLLLLNLLSNAVKFTPPRGEVRLDILRNGNGTLVLQVSDTGVGIAKADRSRIFQEFFHKDHPEVGANQGSGLGLAIVKRVVDAYGGKIQVTSRVGAGSRFRVLLPIPSERESMRNFLEEAWSHSREAGLSVGLILVQLRAKEGKKPGGTKVQALMRELKGTLEGCLRKEDRIFSQPEDILLLAVVSQPKSFAAVSERIRNVLVQSEADRGGAEESRVRWRMVSQLVPRQSGGPAQFLQRVRHSLDSAWREKAA